MWELHYLKEFCAYFHKDAFPEPTIYVNPTAIHALGFLTQSPPLVTLEKPEYRCLCPNQVGAPDGEILQ